MNNAEIFEALEDLYQQSIGGDLESYDYYCTKYLHQLLTKVDSSLRGLMNVYLEPPRITRELMI